MRAPGLPKGNLIRQAFVSCAARDFAPILEPVVGFQYRLGLFLGAILAGHTLCPWVVRRESHVRPYNRYNTRLRTMKSPASILAPRPRRIRRRRQRIRRATILGTGVCVPERVIDNAYFSRELGLETTPEWIENRIGILKRHWAVDESSTDLAVASARSALQHARLEPNDIDLIVVATSTPDFTMPATACLVQGRLGAERALALDVVNACAGFVYGFDVATRYFQSGEMQNALVIGVDRGSRLVDPRDRSTSVFFGDGAGAAVLSSRGAGRVLASKLHSRGNASRCRCRWAAR